MNRNRASAGDVKIREISRKQEIVGFYRGTEQKWPLIPETKRHLRQMTSAFVENPLLAHPVPLNVAVPVKHAE